MRKRITVRLLAPISLLLLAGLAGCVLPSEPLTSVPKDALSFDQLMANLDTLQGQAAKGIGPTGKTLFSLPGGTLLSTQDLSAYLGALRTNLGSYVYSLMNGSPYLVVPVKLTWTASNNGLTNSGLMWVPFTWGRRLSAPVISYQHGTQIFRESAPSRFNPNPLAVLSSADPTGALQNYVESIVGALMASTGYIVVMPDYPGFGDSFEAHPYVHMNLGYSVRDIIDAAGTALAGHAVTPSGKVFLTGYSEGGYATMAGARALQRAGVPVSGVVPCDGAYSLSGVMLYGITSGLPAKVPWYLLYTASGYRAAEGSVIDYDQLLNPSYANLLKGGLFDGTHTGPQIDALVPSSTIPRSMLTDYALSTLLTRPPSPGMPGGAVYNLLAANDGWVGWVPTSPVVLVHSPEDDTVPYANALVARAALIAAAQAYYGSDFQPSMIPPIVDVSPVPLLVTALGSTHEAAYPTAMLAAFTAIETVNRGY